jgi:hypothetical protein
MSTKHRLGPSHVQPLTIDAVPVRYDDRDLFRGP